MLTLRPDFNDSEFASSIRSKISDSKKTKKSAQVSLSPSSINRPNTQANSQAETSPLNESTSAKQISEHIQSSNQAPSNFTTNFSTEKILKLNHGQPNQDELSSTQQHLHQHQTQLNNNPAQFDLQMAQFYQHQQQQNLENQQLLYQQHLQHLHQQQFNQHQLNQQQQNAQQHTQLTTLEPCNPSTNINTFSRHDSFLNNDDETREFDAEDVINN